MMAHPMMMPQPMMVPQPQPMMVPQPQPMMVPQPQPMMVPQPQPRMAPPQQPMGPPPQPMAQQRLPPPRMAQSPYGTMRGPTPNGTFRGPTPSGTFRGPRPPPPGGMGAPGPRLPPPRVGPNQGTFRGPRPATANTPPSSLQYATQVMMTQYPELPIGLQGYVQIQMPYMKFVIPPTNEIKFIWNLNHIKTAKMPSPIDISITSLDPRTNGDRSVVLKCPGPQTTRILFDHLIMVLELIDSKIENKEKVNVDRLVYNWIEASMLQKAEISGAGQKGIHFQAQTMDKRVTNETKHERYIARGHFNEVEDFDEELIESIADEEEDDRSEISQKTIQLEPEPQLQPPPPPPQSQPPPPPPPPQQEHEIESEPGYEVDPIEYESMVKGMRLEEEEATWMQLGDEDEEEIIEIEAEPRPETRPPPMTQPSMERRDSTQSSSSSSSSSSDSSTSTTTATETTVRSEPPAPPAPPAPAAQPPPDAPKFFRELFIPPTPTESTRSSIHSEETPSPPRTPTPPKMPTPPRMPTPPPSPPPPPPAPEPVRRPRTPTPPPSPPPSMRSRTQAEEIAHILDMEKRGTFNGPYRRRTENNRREGGDNLRDALKRRQEPPRRRESQRQEPLRRQESQRQEPPPAPRMPPPGPPKQSFNKRSNSLGKATGDIHSTFSKAMEEIRSRRRPDSPQEPQEPLPDYFDEPLYDRRRSRREAPAPAQPPPPPPPPPVQKHLRREPTNRQPAPTRKATKRLPRTDEISPEEPPADYDFVPEKPIPEYISRIPSKRLTRTERQFMEEFAGNYTSHIPTRATSNRLSRRPTNWKRQSGYVSNDYEYVRKLPSRIEEEPSSFIIEEQNLRRVGTTIGREQPSIRSGREPSLFLIEERDLKRVDTYVEPTLRRGRTTIMREEPIYERQLPGRRSTIQRHI